MNYKIPTKAQILTCGVDVLDDKLEGEIKAWDLKENSWGIIPFKIDGNISEKRVKKELLKILTSSYLRSDGISLQVNCTCIDSGGHFTDEVYRFCKKHIDKNIFAVKGYFIGSGSILSKVNTIDRYKIKLFNINTDKAKIKIGEMLKKGKMHFNKKYDDEYFKQLGSVKKEDGRWRLVYPYTQALDYNIYNLAALKIYIKGG